MAASRIAGPCLIVDHVTFGKRTLLIAIGAVLVALVVARLAGPGPAAVAAVAAGVAAAAVWQLWLNRQADADRRAALAAAAASHAVPAPDPDGGVARFLRPEQEVVAFQPRPELDQLIAWVAADQHSGVQLVTGPGGAGKTRLARELGPRVGPAERRGRVARWLHDLYPETIPDNAAPREWIGPLRPDQVAERLILTELSERPELIPGLFAELRSDQAIRALTVLARAAVRTQAGLGLIRSALASDLEHLAVPAISVAIATNLILGDLLNEALNRQPVSPDVLARLAHAAPHPSFALAPLAATVLTQLVDQSSDIGQRAGRLLDLATRLADLGLWDEGLAAIEEAVAIRRRQVETSPDTFLPDLALSLNNQTAILGTLKRWDEALAAAEEAVSIRRDLARDNPDTVLPDLAQSLNNLSRCLNEMGRPEQALAANEEAVAIRRDSTLDRPEMLFALGAALNNRAISLDALERPAEALAAVEEATRIYRELAATRPDAYLCIFARSLNNQSNSLAALKRQAEALAAAEEATRAYRILALMRPAAFLSDLADSLHNQSLRLREMGREEEALAAMAEANRIRRQK